MLEWTQHPVLPIPSEEQMAAMGPKRLMEFFNAREEAIHLAVTDPLNHGYQLPSWKDVRQMLDEYTEVMAFGGNGGGKSEAGARFVVEAALNNPKAQIVCFAQDDDASVRIQQKYIYKYLPPEYKDDIKSKTAYISYGAKNGFTDASFILPNGTQVYFHTYSQYLNNPAKFEGYEYGSWTPQVSNLAIWLDEYLGDGDMIQTLRPRAARRDAKILFTFTPIDGITDFVGKYYREAETMEWREVDPVVFPEDKEPRRVPYKQVNRKRNAGIIYFHTVENPWGGYERHIKDCLNESIEYRLTRIYGVPTKNLASLLPKFNRDVHVLSDEKMPDISGKDWTRYQIIDPADAKNWFMIWVAVNADGDHVVYREWPDAKNHGNWAHWGRGKFVASDATKSGAGRGFREYAELIRELEGGEPIFERIMDSRGGYSPKTGVERAMTISAGLDDENIFCVPSAGLDEAQGIQRLNDLLAYDNKKPVDAINRPRFYIHESCGNVISSFGFYNNAGKLDEAWGDPVDVCRYAATSQLEHFGKNAFKSTRKTGGY